MNQTGSEAAAARKAVEDAAGVRVLAAGPLVDLGVELPAAEVSVLAAVPVVVDLWREPLDGA